MLTRDDLEEVLAAITVTAPVRSDEVTASTNATALAMAEAGGPNGRWSRPGTRPKGGADWVVPGPTSPTAACCSPSSCVRSSLRPDRICCRCWPAPRWPTRSGPPRVAA